MQFFHEDWDQVVQSGATNLTRTQQELLALLLLKARGHLGAHNPAQQLFTLDTTRDIDDDKFTLAQMLFKQTDTP